MISRGAPDRHAIDARRVERAHYRLQMGLYFTEAVDLEGAVAFFADGMSEPEWNHAALLQTDSLPATAAVLRRIEALFATRGLSAAVGICPASSAPGLATQLADRGFERSYRYAWLAPDGTARRAAAGADGDDEIEIRRVKPPGDESAFLEVFRATYPDGLDAGYERALRRSRSHDVGDCEVVHLLARAGDAPVAVASSIHGLQGDAEGVTGLYNLAVHPHWRRRGLGRRLTRLRVDEARRRHHRVFLQTERSSVEGWQRRHGFRLLFTTDGWVKTRPGSPTRQDQRPQDTT